MGPFLSICFISVLDVIIDARSSPLLEEPPPRE